MRFEVAWSLPDEVADHPHLVKDTFGGRAVILPLIALTGLTQPLPRSIEIVQSRPSGTALSSRNFSNAEINPGG